ncbi:MAG TPA: gliding motility-associated C-terminal domain-containing protein [Fluviicola sp.]|nr:gliding motility-associated C-terminal domain-containing protein [Fluviicola sp.]
MRRDKRMFPQALLLQFVTILLVSACFQITAFSQDVWLQNHSSPVSGCSLSNAEQVNVLINNNSGVVMASNTINVSYTIDGGSLTQQLLNSNLFPGASWNFTFAVDADLSACGTHIMKVWVSRAGDVNQLNDTLQWTVQNDCPIVPGTISGGTTVCASGNSGSLTLGGWSYGTITDWQTSIDAGTTWLPTGTTTTTYNYSGLTQDTRYQVVIDGGLCPDDTAGFADILVQQPVIPGTISGSDSLCITAASGMLNLSGNTGAVVSWESSDDAGASWTTIVNNTTSHNYVGLTATTWFRALVEGSACPDVYTDTAIIYVEPLTDPGDLTGTDSLCITNASGVITVGGNIGSVSFWESSDDNGATWTTISNQTTTLNYSGLTLTTLFRVYTDGGFCPSYYSDTAEIFVQPVPVPPTIAGSDSLCITSASGVLNLVGATTNVLDWESSSNNGVTWSPIGNTTTTLNYNSLTQTTLYRVLLDGKFCSDYYSDTAEIYVEQLTFPGVLTGSDSLCISNASGVINVTGSIGNVTYWQSSDDAGVTWDSIPNTTTGLTFTNLTQTTWYQVYTDGGFCPGYFSDTAIVYVEPLVIPGTLSGSDSVCGISGNGVITLNGGTGTVDHWEYSTDGGLTWTTDPSTAGTYNYNGVATTTLYRVFTVGQFCAGVYSDTAMLYVELPTNAGTLQSSGGVCPGGNYNLTLTGQVANNYSWESSVDGIAWTPVPNAASSTHLVTNVQSDSLFRVIVQNGICGLDTSNAVTITVFPAPVANAGIDTALYLGDSVQLLGSGGVLGVWTPGAFLSDSLITNPFAFPVVTTTYIYTIIDANGCIDDDTMVLTVYPPNELIIRNVITANEDGYNDTWIISGIQYYPSTSVIVFNIYGEEVFKDTDYQNDWKGTYKGNRLPNGTYYYTVIPGGSEEKLKGTLTILGDE